MKKPKYLPFCPYCRGRVEPQDNGQGDHDEPEWYACPTHGEIPLADVEMVSLKELER